MPYSLAAVSDLYCAELARWQPVAKVVLTPNGNAESIGYRPFFRGSGLLPRAARRCQALSSAVFNLVWACYANRMAAKKGMATIDAVALGRAGGKRRAALLTAGQCRATASVAAASRWAAYHAAHAEKLRAKKA